MRFNNEFLKKIPFSKYIAFFSIEGTNKGGSKFDLCFIYKYPTLWVIDGLLKNVCHFIRGLQWAQILKFCIISNFYFSSNFDIALSSCEIYRV